MNNQNPKQLDGIDRAISIGCVIAGVAIMMVLNTVTEGKVPGGAIGGAIGGLVGGLAGAGISTLRHK